MVPLHRLFPNLSVQLVFGALGLCEVFPQAVQRANGGVFLFVIFWST
jgi:hypothetical protein